MRIPFPLLLVAVLTASCSRPDSGNDGRMESREGFTKEIEYAVDANGMFHSDLTDEDFSDISKVMEGLLQDVLNGKVKAYDLETWQPIDPAIVREKLIHADTLFTEDPETGNMLGEVIQRDYSRGFHSVKFRESWRYDPSGSIIERKVTALAPRVPVYSTVGGDLRGYTSLFWVKVE